MATNERKIVNNLNERARFFLGKDAPQLTIYHMRAALDFFGRKCQDPNCPTPDKLAYSIDHYKPLSEGGTQELTNILVLHTNCNKRKGNKIVDWKIKAFCPNDYVNAFIPARLKDANSQNNSTLNNGNPRANGGARIGAGRKPSEFTILKRQLRAQRVEDANHMLDLLTAWAKSDEYDEKFRRECANDVLDWVLGGKSANVGDDVFKQYQENVRAVIFGGQLGSAGTATGIQPSGGGVQPAADADARPLHA